MGNFNAVIMDGRAMSKKKKLLFFVAEDWYFYSHRFVLAAIAQKKGFDVVVATRVSTLQKEIEDAGLKLIPLNHFRRRSRNPITFLRGIFEIYKIYKTERPDIVHHVAMKPILFGSLAAKITRIPLRVNTIAGLGQIFTAEKGLLRILRPFVKFSLRLLINNKKNHIIFQNEDDKTAFRFLKKAETHLIRGVGINTDYFQTLPDPQNKRLIVAFVGRFLWHKGIRDFIVAAQLVKRNGLDVRMIMVGKTDEDSPSAIPLERIQQWDRQSLIEYWGYATDIREVWKQANVAVLPSFGEGLPKSLVEAAACGRPIIATDVPGCREVCIDGETGILVHPHFPRGIYEAILRLSENAALRKKFGANARKKVKESFDEVKILKQILEIYDIA
ncbi:MAG: glycosyltransferase family 4 protein [Alphaproteobacteria bacterium]